MYSNNDAQLTRMGVEQRVLLLASRDRWDARSLDTIAELIAAGLDWTTLVSLALHHRVAAALLQPLRQPAVRPLVPDDIATALAHYVDTARERNQYLASELAAMLSALADAGVEALPLKGAVLGELLYRDLGQRPPGDIDFLVRRRDVTRTCEVLESSGYRRVGTAGIRTAVQHEVYRQYQCEYVFVRDAPTIIVEPHWAVAQHVRALDLDYEAQFAHAQPAVLAGIPVRVHAPDDLLLLLCVHGTKHEWERLGWIRDLAALLEQASALGLDLERALDHARRQGCARIVLAGLEVARQLLDASLTDGVRRAIHDDRVIAAMVDEVRKRLFVSGRPPDNARVTSFGYRMHDRAANRIRYVARTLLMPRAQHIGMVALPSALAWGYYPLRWSHDYVALPLWRLTRPLRASRQRVAASASGNSSAPSS
jgi:hypothetical protein